ncbi:hypothetical protein SAMN04489712_10568 [Thermomonospora echinospora]|uniref:Uncharacterized protein n=1 Tax=Thermomonospora echinospora TaxID=1992 RepID=A0A1H5ZXJ9_9ACTN|nr:hypothetical protein [Thermomonospora echinospora]SEG41179.1 hypothetical protein SAMN04489712_10568 [Thermomonospora echinospora]
MTSPEDDDRRESRPQQDRGPGAHSGHERQVQERVVPGTASAAEGYQTGEDDILAGVRARPGETARPADEEETGTPSGDRGEEPPEDEGQPSFGGRA